MLKDRDGKSQGVSDILSILTYNTIRYFVHEKHAHWRQEVVRSKSVNEMCEKAFVAIRIDMISS
jgi:hypothetical protein